MARLSVFILAILLGLIPAAASAQVNEASDGGFAMRIEGDLVVAEGETVDAAVVIDGNVQVDGTIKDFLMVIDGTADVTGRVDGDIFTISTDLALHDGAVVDGDINMIEGSLNQEPGSQVNGNIDRDFDLEWWQWLLVNILLWIAMTVAVLVFGLLLVAVAPRQAVNAAETMTAAPGQSILAALVTFIGIPVVAVLALFTVIGVVLGLGILLFVLPAVWFLGYLVGGLMIGRLIFSRAGPDVRENLYLSVLAGLGALQLFALVPAIGIIAAILVGFWGAGAFVLVGGRACRWPPGAPPPAPASPV
jgi:hypothetical protein